MKKSSIFILIAILIVFGLIQTWVFREKFLTPSSIEATQATLVGETVTVGTPVSGIVRAIHVKEGQKVERGEPLFTVFQQSPLDPDGGSPVSVVAQRPGQIYDLNTTVDSFVQASQILAKIVDISPQGLYVKATLSVRPDVLSSVVPSREATVRASFLNKGAPTKAYVSTVGLYDAGKKTVDVKLKFASVPTIENIATVVGFPVDVSVRTEGKK
jgi:multidrug resistance efflux pump